VEIADYLDSIRLDSTALAAAGRSGLDAPVTACPGWTVGDLVGHVGQVHQWFALLLNTKDGDRVRFRDVPEPPSGEGAVPWLEESAGTVLAALERTDPDRVVHTWAGEHPARWVFRRIAQETAVHRWDGQDAHDAASPIGTPLAVDGIDEVLEVFVPALPPEALAGSGQTIHLHAADADGEWLITLGPEGLRWEHGHLKADVAARGAASDLLLLLWNRMGTDHLEVFGDEAVLARWRDGYRI
jgi:uncharacterized protein (TIGR03083 family)